MKLKIEKNVPRNVRCSPGKYAIIHEAIGRMSVNDSVLYVCEDPPVIRNRIQSILRSKYGSGIFAVACEGKGVRIWLIKELKT